MAAGTSVSAAPLRCSVEDPVAEERQYVTIRVEHLAANYGIDTALVADTVTLQAWLDESVGETPAQLSSKCNLLNIKILRMTSSLRNNYKITDSLLWIDSSTAAIGSERFLSTLTMCSHFLVRRMQYYDREAQQQMIAEIKAAEAAARKREKRRQQEADSILAEMQKESLRLHLQIAEECQVQPSDDKVRQKDMKDLFYSYLTLYNKYPNSATSSTTTIVRQVHQLHELQHHILDSILGPSSYPKRINDFQKQLRVNSGKEHVDVYKAYMRVIKTMHVPISFGSIEEYQQLARKYRIVIRLQNQYIETITLRQQVASKTAEILARCQKHKDIASSYRTTLSTVNQVPNYANIEEAVRFNDRIREFTEVQKRYVESIQHIEQILSVAQTLQASIPRSASDVGKAYVALQQVTNLVPDYTSIKGAEFYEQYLSDFDKMQELYRLILRQRDSIAARESTLLHHSTTPKELVDGYKALLAQTIITPSFATIEDGVSFCKGLHHFIDVQTVFLEFAKRSQAILENDNALRRQTTELSHTYKAYQRLRKEYDTPIVVANEADLAKLDNRYSRIEKLQAVFLVNIASANRTLTNKQLNKVKDVDKIKLIMNL